MVKKLLFIFCVMLVAVYAQAQPPCGGPPSDIPPAESCPEACIYCDFNGYMGTTAGYAPNGIPPGGFCSQIQNDQWLGFIAGAASATFTITPSNCANGDGVQTALYESCNTAPLACNGGGAGQGNTPTVITVSMVPGTNYFLLIDGLSGDQCDISVTVSPPTAVKAPDVGNMLPLQGPATVCPGATVTMQVPNVPNAGSYTWTGPAGTLINGEPAPVSIDAPDGRIVQVTFPTTTGTAQICVNANNSCDDGPTQCRNINVQPIAPTVIPQETVCFEDLPYVLPWGDEVTSPGDKTHEAVLTSWLGCDSLVRQRVIAKPQLKGSVGFKYICEGGSFTVCGEEFTTSGPIDVICTSFQGCDSLVTGTLTVLDPMAEIIGGGTLTCKTDTIKLSSVPSQSGSIKTWRRNGATVGVGDNYNATIAGTYTLTSRIQLGGVACEKVDTLVIADDKTPPPAAASTNGFIGCGGAATTVTANTTTQNPTYKWTGPNGFNATTQTTTVPLAGIYTVTITSGGNGCTATATTEVTGNTTAPTVNTTNGVITCANITAGITAISSAPNSLFSWVGPNGQTYNIANPTVNQIGTYTVTVTDQTNNCTKTASATVVPDTLSPTASAVPSGFITCQTPLVTLNGSTNATNPSFQWNIPSNLQNPSVDKAGIYTLVVTSGANGCTKSVSVEVTGNTQPPQISAVADTTTLSCAILKALLDGGSTTPDVTYAWAGPNGFTSFKSDTSATEPGLYTLTVSGANLCSSTATVQIDQNVIKPDATADGGIITCGQTKTEIKSSSTTPNVTYKWEGPGNYSSNKQVDSVANTGTYTLTVTGLNGCTQTATAEVKADENVPDAQATGGDLTCANPSIILDGGSTTPGVLLKWSGPGINATNENDEDPLVTVDGLYTLVVTNPLNGCTKIAQATVNLKNDPPGAGAIGETLTCKDPNKTIKGTSPESSVTWDWTGPGGFSSTDQNPSVTTAGVYTVTVRSNVNGCTSTAETTVLEDKAIPVPASTTGTLTCAVKKLTLNGTTNLAGTFTWDGPNGFTFTGANPEVTLDGVYTVSVTPANGCTGSATVTVALDVAVPGALATGNTATCDNPNMPLSVDPATTGLNVTYSWEGPGLPTGSTAQAPTVSVGGIYTVTVTSVGNGCTSTATAELEIDKEAAAIAIANPEVLTCSNPDFNLDATITNQTSGIKTIDWSGPNGFDSKIEDPTVNEKGVYVLIVTSDNGCPSTASVTITEDKVPPGASAAVSGPITCKDPNVKLDGGSQTGITYIWTVPGGGGTLPEEDPTVTVDGVYSLVVTAANGCTSTATVNVAKNVTPPGAQIAKSNDLDCNKTNAILTGTPGTGVKYDWVGPNTFTSKIANPTIAVPGDYTLTTTSDVNGCTSTITVNVTQDIVNPQAPTAAGSTIDCITGTTGITSSSSTPNVTYAWVGPGTYTSNQQNPNNVTVAGTYTVTFKGTNGCTSTASAVVLENKDNPVFTLTGDGSVLTCANDTLPATATITKPTGGTGTWTGPGTFSSVNNDILVSVPGDYTFVVIDPANGCKTTKIVKFTQNIEKPKNVTAEGAQLDCDNPTVTIKSSTTTTNVSYTWAGPGGYNSKVQNPNDVTNNGTYTVTVTDNGNGCTTTASTEVTRDPSIPEITVTTETITCKQPTVVLNSTVSNGIAVTYKWTGPGITPASSTIEDPSVTLPGDYTVVARANTSGCTASFNIKVNEDKVPPGVTTKGDTLNCKETNVTILSNSTTQNVTYVWTDPSGGTLTQQNPVVTLIGTYTVTVTGLNGCTSTATAVVSPDKDAPKVTATGGLVNCTITSIQLQANTQNTGLSWSWTGPGGFTSSDQNPTVTLDGSYVLVATAPNGCSISVGAEVKADKVAPVITIATPNQLNCTTTQVGLSASVTGTGNYTYLWSTTGGNIASGGTSAAPTVTLAGVYQVLVTNTLNGCTSTKEVTVTTDPATPSDMLESVRDVLCFGQTNGVIQITGIVGGTKPFLYSIDNKPFTAQSTFNNLKPGPHTIVVQDANGCELEQTFNIKEPELFVLDLGRDTTITLGSTIILDYTNLVNFPDRLDKIVFEPKTINASGNSLDTLLPKHSFKYKGVAYDTNGCKATDERLIIVDRTRNIYVGNIIKPGSTTFNDRAIVWGGNDVEKIKVFQIYDRWGALVFERRDFLPSATNAPDVDNGWDGLVKGDKGAPGVYVYYLEALFKDGETEYFKGDITLFR